jgi:ribonuclease J
MIKRIKTAPPTRPKSAKKREEKEAPLRWVALGGLEEIGRNMMFFEYKNEIIIIDVGLQFPEEETPGVDYIIPNVSYLEARRDKIRGIVITHGHYDHIGALPYVLDKLGNPPIYATLLTKEIILKRQEDFPNAPKPVFVVVKAGETHQISEHFILEFFAVEHNIPEGVGMVINTPIGKIVHPGEFKFDYDHDGKPRNLEVWEKIGKQGIHTLFLDSTGAEVPGYSLSERVVERELEKLFRAARGRIIVATFASLLGRIGEIIKIAEKLGRRVAFSGYSLKTNVDIAINLGYIKPEPGTIIPIEDIHKYRDDKILILSTGAQGEPRASLVRIANGEHKQITLKKTDTVILSSSIIPGNEYSIQILKDNIARQCPNVFHYKMLDIHSSGHAPIEELKTVMKLVKPRFFIPIHGYYFMRMRNARHAQEVLGLPPESTIVADNGLVVELRKDSVKLTEEQVPASYVMVDGLGVGDVEEVVLRDRRSLAQEGMVVVIVTLDRKRAGRLLKNPDIISRGFILLKENQDILEGIRRHIRGIISRLPAHQTVEPDYLKALIRDQIGQFLYKKTKRRPMILPVVIEI